MTDRIVSARASLGNYKMPVPQQKEPTMETIALTATTREPWNKGKLVGQKTPFKLKEIWAIRVRLDWIPLITALTHLDGQRRR